MSATHQALIATAGAAASDPSFSSVKGLYHFDGTNGATTCTDSSSLANHSISGSNRSLTTTAPEYGSACLSVANGNAVIPDNVALQLGTGDFTVEFSFKTASPTQVKNLFDFNAEQSHPTNGFIIYIQSSTFKFYQNGTDRITGGTVATSTWQKIAVSRASGTTRLYINGTQVGSNYTDGNTYNHGDSYIGGDGSNLANSTGTYDELRITVGVGRYTGSSYTVATQAFPNS